MRVFMTPCAFALVAILAGAPAFAQGDVLYPGNDEFTKHGTVGEWTIYADSERKSCLIEHVDPNGSVIQMGLTSDRSLGYVGVFTNKDVGLPEVKDAEITIQVNGHTYTGRSHPMQHKLADGYRGGYVLANNPDFVKDVENGTEMMVMGDKSQQGVSILLTGTHDAIKEAIACTEKM